MKAIKSFLIILFSIFLCSCGMNENPDGESNIRNVVKNFFGTISEQEYMEIQEWESQSGNGTEGLPAWMDEKFGAYLSEECYENFVADLLYQIPVLVYESNLNIQMGDITVAEKDGYYEFKTELEVDQKEDSSEIQIDGTMQINSDERITDININQLNEIMQMIMADSDEKVSFGQLWNSNDAAC